MQAEAIEYGRATVKSYKERCILYERKNQVISIWGSKVETKQNVE